MMPASGVFHSIKNITHFFPSSYSQKRILQQVIYNIYLEVEVDNPGALLAQKISVVTNQISGREAA